MYSVYYQAHVDRSSCWFVVAVFKSFEHMLFDRTIDVEKSTFEFFVAPAAEKIFLQVMDYMQKEGHVSDLQKLPNRLADLAEKL